MKYVLLAGSLLIASCNTAQNQVAQTADSGISKAEKSVAYAATIQREELKEHLYTYASDEFMGRETGTEGETKATEYLINAYKEMGIEAAQSNGEYLQGVPLVRYGLPSGSVQIGQEKFQIGEELIALSNLSSATGELVYAGYGIDDPAYSSYTDLDVKGKTVIIRIGEPKNEDGTYVLTGTNTPGDWSNWRETLQDRRNIAFEKGAEAIIYLDDAYYSRAKQRYNYYKSSNFSGRLSLASENADKTFLVAGEDFMKSTLDNMAPSAMEGTTVTIDGEIQKEEVMANNVVAYIKGKSKPEEYIVISAHLDHIGVSSDGEVNNGADDDGSGTVAILEIAEAFKKAVDEGNGPERSVVFLHVTGEEKGLFGSQYYTENPIFPMEKTLTDLNIDMIGRIDPKREGDRNYIYLIGSDKLSTELHEISEQVNAQFTGITLDYTYNDKNDPNRFYYRSDHYNFVKHNIPVIFYFNGTHDDYHRVSDTPDKIEYDLLESRSRLVFHTAWEIANREKSIEVDKAE